MKQRGMGLATASASMLLALLGCATDVTPSENGEPIGGKADDTTSGLAVLGGGTHSSDAVQITEIADGADGLSSPSDVALNPSADELWITNRANDTMTIVDQPGTSDAEANTYGGPGNEHFLANPSGLAFGTGGMLATIHMEHERTQPTTPADFMGPTMWTSQRHLFDGGHQGHTDMLHNSPDGAGIAWWTGNAYFVWDGWHGSLTYYDFREDHGPGGSYHGDGLVLRFVEGEMGYVAGVPSHLEVDHGEGVVYAADTGNNRIVRLDPTTGDVGSALHPNYDGTQQLAIDDADFSTVADGDDVGLSVPSGLAIHDGHIYVGDNSLSHIVAITKEGAVVDYLDLSDVVDSGGLTGITFDDDGNLYVADAEDDRVLRISPAE